MDFLKMIWFIFPMGDPLLGASIKANPRVGSLNTGCEQLDSAMS
jgi:hypothetical protein